MILATVKDVAKVTSKLQLTVPKAIADHYGIRPGDELDWIPAGEWSTLTFCFTAATGEIQPSARALAQYCVGGNPPGTSASPSNHWSSL
ncbi:MAG TPA: AbrB/MazE/SpoVT family DNA-binding domain-containing protein [Candidatus Sulfotelmatobacter sp.]